MKQKNIKQKNIKHSMYWKGLLLALLPVFMLLAVKPDIVQGKAVPDSKRLEASSDNLTALSSEDAAGTKKTADIVFVIDTTLSMSEPIKNLKSQLKDFVDSISKEDVDVRIRLVSFRDITCWYRYLDEDSFKTYPLDDVAYSGVNDYEKWYTRENIGEAVEQLEKGVFLTDGGGDYEETPLVSLVDILKNENYFMRNDDGEIKETLGKYCILITDADYKRDIVYGEVYNGVGSCSGSPGLVGTYGQEGWVDTTASLGAVAGTDSPIGIVEKLRERGIHTSVITKETSALKESYNKFVTPSSSSAEKDGGMLADINGDYSVIFEELARRIKEDVDSKAGEVAIGKKIMKPVKIKANMAVFKKEEGCTYQIVPGKLKWIDVENEQYEFAEKDVDWSEPQESAVFKGLTPSSIYSFRITEKKADGTEEHGYYTLKTESVIGAQFEALPKTIYEGEVYNIKLDRDLRELIGVSGSSITWSCDSDCVSVIKDDLGSGCQMSVIDCRYNNDKPITITLEANLEYIKKGRNGTQSTKSEVLKRKIKVENTVDDLEIGEFHGTSENIYKDGLIILRTKEAVTFDMILNQGETADTASKQKLIYFISDSYGVMNKKGRSIAKVRGEELIGVNPGVTYLTIALKHTYNKYEKCYDCSVTIPVLCREVESVSFDSTKLEKEDDSILKYEYDSFFNGSGEYVVHANKGGKIDLKSYVSYNPEKVFNQENMKETWVSSDTQVVRVNNKGVIKCRGEGYAVVTLTPVGGLKISASTGKQDLNVSPCYASILIKVTKENK